MSHLQITSLILYTIVLVVWLTRHLLVSRTHRVTPLLTAQHPGYRQDDAPLVSVLIPAKDEEATIGDCVLSILNQSYLRLEVIVIDDRSEDGTANVVREIAERDPRVRLVETTHLPSGWTGKTNALATGTRAARGAWLLFIDSDTRHQPENLSILMEFARRERADMVSILPRLRNGSFWERVVQPLAGLIVMLNYPLERVNDDSARSTAFANGQYILMRRKTYNAVGGHAAVRDKFVEDIHLARMVKSKGYRVRVAVAPGLTSTRMYTSLGELVRGWSRILYAAYDYSAARLAGVFTGLAFFSLSAYAVLVGVVIDWLRGGGSGFTASIFAMCLAHLFLQTTVMARAYAFTASQRRYLAFYAVASAVMFWVLCSAFLKCFTHRVVWRGTEYERLQDPRRVLLPMRGEAALHTEIPLKQTA